MDPFEEVSPLSYKKRQRTFFLLLFLFVTSLPFLFLYATGYRFDLSDSNAIVGTGGIYVAAERTGAQIFIDNELVRETRVFRTAFYAQNLEPRTHRVHVQKEGHHTWVKELPVTPHRVTEAQAFNLPLVPRLRVISEWQTATGSQLVHTPLPYASTTNFVTATSSRATSTRIVNPEFKPLLNFFTATATPSAADRPFIQIVQNGITSTTSAETTVATSTRGNGDVRLSRDHEDNVYAEWVGSFDQMPYYYCAAPFPRYSTTSEEEAPISLAPLLDDEAFLALTTEADPEFVHPVQVASVDDACDRRIQIVGNGPIRGFEFFPGSTDLVLLELQDGIYVSEIDARAWQNLQPVLRGSNLDVHVENGGIYVYDGTLIYQVILDA